MKKALRGGVSQYRLEYTAEQIKEEALSLRVNMTLSPVTVYHILYRRYMRVKRDPQLLVLSRKSPHLKTLVELITGGLSLRYESLTPGVSVRYTRKVNRDTRTLHMKLIERLANDPDLTLVNTEDKIDEETGAATRVFSYEDKNDPDVLSLTLVVGLGN